MKGHFKKNLIEIIRLEMEGMFLEKRLCNSILINFIKKNVQSVI